MRHSGRVDRLLCQANSLLNDHSGITEEESSESSTTSFDSRSGSSSNTDGYDSVCDDASTEDSAADRPAAAVRQNCNNSGVKQAAWTGAARARLKRRLRRRVQRKRERDSVRQLQGLPATTDKATELTSWQSSQQNQQNQQPTTSTAVGTTAAAVDQLRGRMDANIRSGIDDLNGTLDSLMRLNISANCRSRKQSEPLDDSETTTEWVTADVSPLIEDYEGQQRQTTSSELSSCGSSSWCPMNVLYDRQHFCPSKKKQKQIDNQRAKAAERLRQQNRLLWKQNQKHSPVQQLLWQLQPQKRKRNHHQQEQPPEQELMLQKPMKAPQKETVESPVAARYLSKRLEGLDALLLTIQENKSDCGKLLLRLKRETAAYHDILLMLQATEQQKRAEQQHQRLGRRWNFRRHWGPIPPPTRKMCSAAKDGYVPKGGASCLDRRDRWLLKYMPARQRRVLPRLLDGADFDDEEISGGSAGAGLVMTRERGRRSNACHNLRDSHEDAIRRYVYAVLS